MAFVLPILHDLKGPEKVGYRAVIISPTRELATQVRLSATLTAAQMGISVQMDYQTVLKTDSCLLSYAHNRSSTKSRSLASEESSRSAC